MRLTGLGGSGIDIDTSVKDLLKAERLKLNKLKQDKELQGWKQSSFREVISQVSDFRNKYLDILSKDSIISSQNLTNSSNTITLNGVDSSVLSAVGISSIGNIEINKITSLATKDLWNGTKIDLENVSTKNLNLNNIQTNGLEFMLTIDNTPKTITISTLESGTISNIDDLKNMLNNKIKDSFGNDFSNLVSTNGSELIFDKTGNNIKIYHTLGNETDLNDLGLTNGISSNDYKLKSIKDVLGVNNTDLVGLKINGKDVSNITENDTIQSFMDKINGGNYGLSLNFDSLNEKFTMSSNKEGSSNNISLNSSMETLMGKFGISTSTRIEGSNAKLTINNTEIIKDSNSFNLDGMNINLNKTYDGLQGNIKVSSNIDSSKIVEKIKSFVTDYNKLYDSINGKINEKYDKNYKPLTDEQRENMGETEIKLWEDKAKTGLLSGNKELNSMLNQLRRSFFDSITDSGKNTRDIGLSGSSINGNYGKLVLDETKLKTSLDNNYTEVLNIFTKTSNYQYGDVINKNIRYNENGIGQRLSDIIKDYVGNVAGTGFSKGYLVNMAGKTGDVSVVNNTISKNITAIDKQIDVLNRKMAEKENKYYTMFSVMESYINKMNQQSSWLSNQK